MGSPLVTRLGQYYGMQCTGCHNTIPGEFNDVETVKRRFAQHLVSSPECLTKKAECLFLRGGRVRWKE
jgi:hypothetical protein